MLNFRFLRILATIAAIAAGFATESSACTGISLKSKDGSKVIGRTMEWGTFIMKSNLMIIPRGYTQISETPTGRNGMKIVAKYGYVGIGVLDDYLIAEGVNEKGLVGELFYFPHYGKYPEYDRSQNDITITDAQFLSWALGNFATIDEMEKEIRNIRVTGYGHGFEAAHFSLADATGRRVVIEYIDGELKIHENLIGIITNAPDYDWHMKNLNTYANLFAGGTPSYELVPGVKISPFGAGSGALGLPGDLTPPSRFIRAAFYAHTARVQDTGHETVIQLFKMLNNFDIPVGAEFSDPEIMPDMMTATQWTTATDIDAMKFYYRTQWNYTIRCVNLNNIDFGKVKYQILPLDNVKEDPIEYIYIK